MKTEFYRYGFSKYRYITGCLQIAGSTGLLAGFYFKPLTLISSIGLSLMMLSAIGVRIKIKDSFLAIIPAFVFMCINIIIAINYL
jgi:hypothetical protein